MKKWHVVAAVIAMMLALLIISAMGCGESYTQQDLDIAYNEGWLDGFQAAEKAMKPKTAVTPTPTAPEEEPVFTPSEQAYAASVADLTTTVGKAFIELGELCQKPQFGNDQWTIQVATQIAIIRVTYHQTMELDPPSSMAEIHLKYTQAMKHFNDATYLLAQGIDELDPGLVDAAAEELLTGNQLIEEANQLILEFKETHR